MNTTQPESVVADRGDASEMGQETRHHVTVFPIPTSIKILSSIWIPSG